MKRRCQARVSIRLGNHRCSFKASETYKSGDITLHLCVGHWRVIRYRGHLADEFALVERWLSVDPADQWRRDG